MKTIDWTKVAETGGSSDKLPAGGYACKITNVEDYPDKEYLKLEYEIVDGEYKGYGEKTAGGGWWRLSFIRSYKPKAMGFFKHFLSSLEKSNPKFNCSMLKDDPNVLRGLYIGLVVGYEEYVNNSGETKERLYVEDTIPGADVRSGNFKTPELKKLKEDSPKFDPTPAAVTDHGTNEDDLPF